MITGNFEYPEKLKQKYNKAVRLEWLTILYLISTALATYLTMGNSQTMKTAWYEDILSLTPAVAFLIASRVYLLKPNKKFPYGYHRIVSIAFLFSSISLLAIGVFLIYDSSLTLIHGDHPTVGLTVVFGNTFWLGYLMIVALVWGTIPSYFLGKVKIPLAEKLHDKNLFTDAQMNKANWMTALAAIGGVIGIGLGYWWADSVAAIIISVDIVHDGYKNVKQAIFDLMDERPGTVKKERKDPVIDKIHKLLKKEKWIEDFRIRLREEGHIYFGEAFILPSSENDMTKNIDQITKKILNINWRIHDFTIMPVTELTNETE